MTNESTQPAVMWWDGGERAITAREKAVIEEHRSSCFSIPLMAVPAGWALVPERMTLDPSAMDYLATQLAGPEPDSRDVEERWCGGLLWVGETQDDDGKKYHGLNVANTECPEEGSIPVVEFPAMTPPATFQLAGPEPLWCLHVLGMDDVHPAPSKAHAEKAAAWHNEQFKEQAARIGINIEAVVVPWPHSAESHAAGVADFIPEWLIPQWQLDALESKDAPPAQGVDLVRALDIMWHWQEQLGGHVFDARDVARTLTSTDMQSIGVDAGACIDATNRNEAIVLAKREILRALQASQRDAAPGVDRG